MKANCKKQGKIWENKQYKTSLLWIIGSSYENAGKMSHFTYNKNKPNKFIWFIHLLIVEWKIKIERLDKLFLTNRYFKWISILKRFLKKIKSIYRMLWLIDEIAMLRLNAKKAKNCVFCILIDTAGVNWKMSKLVWLNLKQTKN